MINLVHLLHDAWIPVIRRDGTREQITPDQITTDYDQNPILGLDAPRPDFSGALIQFLIGLVQTAIPPHTDREWLQGLNQVPSRDTLENAFSQFSEAFRVDGEKNRFMQDPSAADGGDRVPIRNLLIEYPAGRDIFVKKNLINQICPFCAAQALFTFQLNGPPSGRGYFTGIRGSNPITCIIPGTTLWKTIYQNILPEMAWRHCEKPDTIDLTLIFPWLGTIRSKEIMPRISIEDVHPLQIFWGMPNRFYLHFESSRDVTCDLCGKKADISVREFFRKPYGIGYDDTWGIHPLTPHQQFSGIQVASRLKPEKFSYRHYPDLTQRVSTAQTSPALVITHYNQMANYCRSSIEKVQLWSFGFDMDNAKANCWYESRIPVFMGLDEKYQTLLENRIQHLVQTAEYVQQKLSSAVKSVLSGKEPGIIKIRYWSESEPVFYTTLEKVVHSLQDIEETNQIKLLWLQNLRNLALSLFDEYTQVDLILDLQNAKDIIKERRNLGRFTGKNGKKIRTLLGLLIND